MKRILCFMLCLLFLPSAASAADYEQHWAFREINEALSKGILTGDEFGRINPDRAVTRAEFACVLVRALSLKPSFSSSVFEDVPYHAWYYHYIYTAKENNIIHGIDNTHFAPDDPITRQDAAVMAGRAFAVKPDIGIDIAVYRDAVDIPDYALGYIGAFSSLGILNGYDDDTIRPLENITRAEAVVMISRLQQPADAGTVSFEKGYPRMAQNMLPNGFHITLKTTRPCTVYYKLSDTALAGSSLVPSADEITEKLIDIRGTDEITCFVPADPDKEYNIFFAAKTDGSAGRVAWISNARAHIYTEGDGSADNPYRIYNQAQLENIRYQPDRFYRLQNDIVLSSSWLPICSEQSNPFNGTLDGNGHTISALRIEERKDNLGLFGYIGSSGRVKNLYVDALTVNGANNTGILAGENNGIIENCQTSGHVISDNNTAGGIVGTNNGTIRSCISAAVLIRASTYAGGICGFNYGTVESSASYCRAISSDMYAGGISAINSGGQIQNCLAADMRITVLIASNSSRIAVNRLNGTTVNNYGYNKMDAVLSDGYYGENNQNGKDVSWDTLTQIDFYRDMLAWDTSTVWGINQSSGFLPASLKELPVPRLTEGETIYIPKKISSAEELAEIDHNRDGNYILTADIFLTDPWTPIAGEATLLEDNSAGFSGSLNGNGHTIYNLRVPYHYDRKLYGLFGMISGGIVENIVLDSVSFDSSEYTGALAGVNYGAILSCKASGTITARQTDSALFAGGICGANYGQIERCDTQTELRIKGNDTTSGGICAYNEDYLNDCSARGNISVTGTGSRSNTVIGGIVGFSADGLVYNSYTSSQLTASAQTAYIGGIAGMLDSGEIYKASTRGKIIITDSPNSTQYGGGIAGLSNSGLIFNSFSNMHVSAAGDSSYIGGIAGYNISCNIQENYTTNTLTQKSVKQQYAGGICGINESGFISANAAINPSVTSLGSVARICCMSAPDLLSNNFGYEAMRLNDKTVKTSVLNGLSVAYHDLKNLDFFFLPLDQGGTLGWSSTKYQGADGIWMGYPQINSLYPFPLLNNVKYQDTFTVPKYTDR